MANFLPQKPPTFTCEPCHFITSNKKDYSRHISTAKHNRLIESSKVKHANISHEHRCHCGKTYLHQSSLCKHRNKCKKTSDQKDGLESPSSDMIYKLLNDLVVTQNQNAEYQRKMIELMNDKTSAISNITNNTTTTNNMQININMFLNEYCKDAITIGEFIKSVQPSIEDVFYMTKHGNKEGLSKILTTALGQLEITERPLHCTDLKRNTTYVKEPEGWIKDKDDMHMKKLCLTTQHECIKTAANLLTEDATFIERDSEETIRMMEETTKDPEYDSIFKTLNESVLLNKQTIQKTIQNK